jgi:hypothetical protein
MFFYNPNIMPAPEYEKRLSEQRKLASILGIRLIEAEHKVIKMNADCGHCIGLRLDETARYAKEVGFDAFTTTLSVSPHKDAALINRILAEKGEKHGVAPLCADFKKQDGFKRSVELSKQYGLYRQKYCGCEPGKD